MEKWNSRARGTVPPKYIVQLNYFYENATYYVMLRLELEA